MAMDLDKRYLGMGRAGTVDQVVVDQALRAYMLKVYNIMGSGLLLSGIVAVVIAQSPGLMSLFFTERLAPTGLGLVAMLSPLGLLLWMSFGINRMSSGFLQGLYWVFTALFGISMAVLLHRYTGASVARAFFVTAATFGAMSLYGYTTKRNLTGWGSFLLMGLIGIIIAAVVNMFLASAMMHFVISAVGVLVFTGLTAYDTQRIKSEFDEADPAELQNKRAIFGAVALYLNFINLFQLMLAFLGNRE
ncbi:MAG: Bax inhibitor-1/YccA family protein [Alphaproteobacteria bacterium]|nr:Bax inhibitor-1/YccA family protein [Alphaproteobacteria bacterium]